MFRYMYNWGDVRNYFGVGKVLFAGVGAVCGVYMENLEAFGRVLLEKFWKICVICLHFNFAVGTI